MNRRVGTLRQPRFLTPAMRNDEPVAVSGKFVPTHWQLRKEYFNLPLTGVQEFRMLKPAEYLWLSSC